MAEVEVFGTRSLNRISNARMTNEETISQKFLKTFSQIKKKMNEKRKQKIGMWLLPPTEDQDEEGNKPGI